MARRLKSEATAPTTNEQGASGDQPKPDVGKSYCGTCGAEWPPSPKGGFFTSCGHMTAKRVDDPSKAESYNPPAGLARDPKLALDGRNTRREEPPTHVTNNVSVAASGETVDVTFGEELYTPQQYFSFRVGPYRGTTTVRPGETRVQAGERLYAELSALADKERTKKMNVFLDSVAQLFTAVKERKGA